MSHLLIIGIFILGCILCSCSVVPQMLGEAEHIIDDTAITVKCSQEALSKNSDLKISVELNNSKP